MVRLKALYRSWAIPCAGQQVYAPRHRADWLEKIAEAGVRRRAELYYQQFDALLLLHQQARRELLAESRKHNATQLLSHPIDRADSCSSVARAHPDATAVPHQATTVELQRLGLGDPQQWK